MCNLDGNVVMERPHTFGARLLSLTCYSNSVHQPCLLDLAISSRRMGAMLVHVLALRALCDVVDDSVQFRLSTEDSELDTQY